MLMTSNCGNLDDQKMNLVPSHIVAHAPRLGLRKSKGGDVVGAESLWTGNCSLSAGWAGQGQGA